MSYTWLIQCDATPSCWVTVWCVALLVVVALCCLSSSVMLLLADLDETTHRRPTGCCLVRPSNNSVICCRRRPLLMHRSVWWLTWWWGCRYIHGLWASQWSVFMAPSAKCRQTTNADWPENTKLRRLTQDEDDGGANLSPPLTQLRMHVMLRGCPNIFIVRQCLMRA